MDKNVFTGCVMFNLKSIDNNFDWITHLSQYVDKNNTIELENTMHVTLMYGIHRDDLKKINIESLCNSISNVSDTRNIELHRNFTFFETTDKRIVAKYGVEQSHITFLQLLILRQHIFKTCRALETHPNYIPHVTFGYFKHMIDNIPLPQTLFKIDSISISYDDDSDNRISRTYDATTYGYIKPETLSESKLINAGDSVKNDTVKNQFINLISKHDVDTIFGDLIHSNSVDNVYNAKLDAMLIAYKNVISHLEKEGAITVRGYKIQKNI